MPRVVFRWLWGLDRFNTLVSDAPGLRPRKWSPLMTRKAWVSPSWGSRFSSLAISGQDWKIYDCSVALPNNVLAPEILMPNIFEWRTLNWTPYEPGPDQRSLGSDEILKIVSWNIYFGVLGCAQRALAAMSHLQDVFGDSPSRLVIMLQEVTSVSQSAMMEHPWVKHNFVLSNVDSKNRYFTITMVSKDVHVAKWFRMPLPGNMERDALIVDIPVGACGKQQPPLKRIMRICTTHLESLWEDEGHEFRPLQLALTSALLKAPPQHDTHIVAGLVGGDMNSISPVDAISYKRDDIDLRDVWEEAPPPPASPLKPFQKDLTFGRAKGNTWGYHSINSKNRRRLDKFLYTGSIDILALDEIRDLTGKIGRQGIHLKTLAEVWEAERAFPEMKKVKGGYVETPSIINLDPDDEERRTRCKNGVRKKVELWV